jgi:polysaccharide chain length determinant protein (PEP-CTERM system associated)
MSVEFRQRSIGEFIAMVKRQKWLVLLPTIAMTAAIGYVVYKLPSIYESTTLLTVKPPTISTNLVQALTNEDLSQRLQTINSEVLSRSVLEPMVTKYDLYKIERESGMPMELVIDRMYKAIKVEPEESGSEKVAAFRIKYRNSDPQAARNVTAELASKYVNTQVQTQNEIAESTRLLFDNQLQEKKKALDELEKQRLDIMMQNVQTLPESEQGLVAQLQGLRQREESIIKEKETLSNEKGRLNDSIRALNSQARLIEDFGEKETQDVARNTTSIEDSPAYAQLIAKRADLSAKLEKLKAQYREKHPEVVDTKIQIDKVNDELNNLAKNSDKRVQTATAASSRKAELQKQNILIEKQKAEGQIAQIEQQFTFKDKEIQMNAGQIQVLEARINTIPNVKVALEGVTAQYQSAKQSYDEILKKKNDAETVVGVEANRQGESIRVQDPANIPQSPVAPKRAVLTLVGSGIGLLIGLLLAGIFEMPRIFRIQNIADAKHYTGLPVLASVPPLLSHDEKMWQKRSYWLKVMAGVVIALGVIPVIVMILQATRLFDRLVS